MGWLDRLKRVARFIYLKLFRINDTPLKIALGFGLGVFLGVMPGVGPAAALVLAVVFRVNRVSALLGSILFNTWVALIALMLAVKVGALVLGRDDKQLHAVVTGLFKDFQWGKLWGLSLDDVLLPVGVGFLIISLALAVFSACVVYLIARWIKNRRMVKSGS